MSDWFSVLAARPAQAVTGWRDGRSVAHGAFLTQVQAWRALALRTPGTQIALYLDDSLAFAAALLGAWQAGKTVWLTADTVDASCSALAGQVDAFFGSFPAQWQAMQPAASDACTLPWLALAPDMAALVVHTSGSTGAPQAIPKRLSQMTAEVATLEQLFGAAIGPADIVATVSHQHIYGLLFKVLWPLAAGRAIHAHSLNYPEQLAATLAQRPCVLVASPAHLKRLPEHLDWRGAQTMLRAVFSSGGPLAPEAATAAARMLGCTPTEIYGSSETGGIACRRRQSASNGAWEAMPGVEWRSADGVALLEVRSAHLEHDGWMRLADRVEAAGANRFLLLGRSDRLLKIEEKRISLDAMEAALVASGLAQEARVALCHQVAGERQALAAFVVPTPEGSALLAAQGKSALNARLRACLSGVVEAVALPRRWRYLDQLPINAQGKTTQALLLALLGDSADAAPRTPRVTLLERDGTHVLLSLTVPANLYYLEGHFPDAPILPGVVQVDWAIGQARQYFTLAPVFRGINALKFQQVILPEVPVFLELTHDPAKDTLQFRYFSDAGPHAGGRILFGN
ncbi:AMP-binding protein [Massilia sp. CF038]|uniref:AMP-binding protein n=1 Tax=Massilia sp. CF038 TaxID=1881045 RepID=UPI000920F213|nr:AMP-binding protein [Massilia sp. CF038]SHG68242.1 Acyl-coenzyme A synthetase/AMP-(fatty) acid ligase [Massilia sp. CF038]